jgi:hypothetical protein
LTFATKELVLARARRVALPPAAPLAHREFCRTLVIPDGPLRGSRYLPSADPVHDCLSREVGSGAWQRVVSVGAVQTGKTLATVLVPLLRSLTILRQPCVYSQPTLTKLHEGWAGKLAPSIRDSGYGGWLPDKGQGAKGSQTPKFITFRDPKTGARAGTLYLIPGGGVSESAQAAVTAAVVCLDEVDSFADRHRIELVGKRADAYGAKALRIFTSTVKSDDVEGEGSSIILALYHESTESRLWFQCPACSHWQPLEWERVSYDQSDEPAAIASARYACEGCALAWTEDQRQQALRSWRLVHRGQTVDQPTGAVIGTPPLTVAFGLLWTSLDSSLRSLGQVAAEHWRASRSLNLGDHGPMRSFFRDQLCKPYEGERDMMENGRDLSWRFLLDRSNATEWGPARPVTDKGIEEAGHLYSRHLAPIPPQANFCAAGIDVQANRIYWVLTAAALDGTTYDLAWGYEMARLDHQPWAEVELHAMLDRLDAFLMQTYGTLQMAPHGVDTGDFTDPLMNWLRGRDRTWKPTKGLSRSMQAEPGDIPGYVYMRDGLIFIDTDSMREAIHAAYKRPVGTVGACHIPCGLQNNSSDTSYLRHLCAERRVVDPKTKKDKIARGPGRWDLQDARRIAEAMIRLRLAANNKPKPKRRFGNLGTI